MAVNALNKNTNKRLHMGSQVREVFLKSGLTVKQFADMIPCRVGNIYKIYEREEINAGLLKKICEVLKYDFFKLYSHELQLEPPDCMRITCNVTIPIEDWKEGLICQHCKTYKMQFNQEKDK